MRLAAVGGMTMDTGLYRIQLTGFAGLARVAGITGSLSGRLENTATNYFNSKLIWLPAVLIAGLGAWMLLSGSASNTADNQLVHLVTAAATEPVQMPAADAALTLRNGNDYAVKDIEVFCSFARRDGSHLTDRKRVIHDIVNMKSQRTFARMHVGFVNINANQAKCSLLAASHV